MGTNDITGDKIITRLPNAAFSSGYDRIWGNNPSTVITDDAIPQTIADMVEQDKDKKDDAIATNLSGN